MKILFIGNDPAILSFVTASVRLRDPDATVVSSATITGGLETLDRESPDLVVMYPDFSDLTLTGAIQGLRRLSNVPLIVVGHPADTTQLIASMLTGADDFVYSNCQSTELMVRMWARLRRSSAPLVNQPEVPYRVGQLLILPDRYEAFLNDQPLKLTTKEFQLLHLLASNAGSVVSRDRLLDVVWGADAPNVSVVKKYIQRLRSKLGDNAQSPLWIVTMHGIGYRLLGRVQSAY